MLPQVIINEATIEVAGHTIDLVGDPEFGEDGTISIRVNTSDLDYFADLVNTVAQLSYRLPSADAAA